MKFRIAALLALPALLVSWCVVGAQASENEVREERARAFVAALNGADLQAYEEFFATHRTTPFTEHSRAAYERIVSEFGTLTVKDVRIEGQGLALVCAAGRLDEPVTIRFRFEPAAPYRIDAVALEAGESAPADTPRWPLPQIAPDDPDAEIAARLGAWLGDRARADEFSGVVVLTRAGRTVYEGAFGLAERSFRIPNTPQTRFRVGSITKSFVQVAVARLVQEGRLDPQATLAEVLPDYPRLDIAGAITVDQLLAHRSGLGGMNYRAYLDTHAPDIRRPMDYVTLFADTPLLFEPGSAEEYSNAGYIVLGAILEAVSGRRFEDLITEFVFEPAGMVSSCFVELDRPSVPVATGYWHCDPAQPELWCVNTPRLELVATASGGSYSTAMDLIRFDRALRAGRLLEPGYTAWAFTGEWPDASGAAEERTGAWPTQGIAGGAEGVSAVLVASDEMALSVVGNLGEDSAEAVGVAIGRSLGLVPR